MWKMPSQALMWERKAFPSPCPEWAPFTRPAMSTTFRKAGTLLKSQTTNQWDRNPWNYKRLSGETVMKQTWLVCGTGRGNQSAHPAQVPCSHLGQLCRMGSSLQKLDFWSAHWKRWISCNGQGQENPEWWLQHLFIHSQHTYFVNSYIIYNTHIPDIR